MNSRFIRVARRAPRIAPKRVSRASPAARLALSLFAASPLAAPALYAQGTEAAHSEQLIVIGERVYPVVNTVAPLTSDAVDTAELLKQLPGANLNANGMLTGIAQYRGLYGDRVAVSLDGLRTVMGGPNAMDAPLSYASPLLLDRLSLERGIASVSSAVESLGGHLHVEHDRGQHRDEAGFAVAGKAHARYASNADLNSLAAQLVGANTTHKVALLAQRDRADDMHFPGGELTPSQLERDRYDLSYAYRDDDRRVLVYAGRLDTADTGTPALPMDIRSIETDLYGVRLSTAIGRASELDIALGHSAVDHVMDNFALRTPPAAPAGYRSTQAQGDGNQWRVGSRTPLGNGELRIGIDGETSEHSAVITNPHAPMLRIDNFASAERNIVGLYTQWNGSRARLDLEAGVRVNRVSTDAGAVSATFPTMNSMMQMMAVHAETLAAAFNGSDLDRKHTNVDAVVKVGRVVGEMRSIYLEIARKTRAPAYQELFLWLPMESTGGLADGRSYIGNPALEPEISREINLGSNWRADRAWFAPQMFYKDISGYIQGVPSTNATANAVAQMMSGMPALEFANTAARIHGLDFAWGYYLTESIVVDGVVTYVRGRRTDVADHLYRLAPLNGRVSVTYEAEDWSARVEAIAYARQRRVAEYNGESVTPGYGIVNASLKWQLGSSLMLTATVENVFDRLYRDHLDGINRVAAIDVPLRARLYGLGRNAHVGVSFSW